MNVIIPTYIEGTLDGQYRGYFESKGSFTSNSIKKSSKYSVDLYKDLRIQQAVIIDEATYNLTKDDETWWRIQHTAEAAIEFVNPFFEQFSFLRHKPYEVYVQFPKIGLLNKQDGNTKTFGKLNGKIRAKLIEPPKQVSVKAVPITVSSNPVKSVSDEPTKAVNEGCNGCFSPNDKVNTYFGLKDGVNGTGGCYGLSGGNNGYKGCFGDYGNPTGCYQNPVSQQGCFPNFGLGVLLPLLFFFLFLFSIIKSCSHIRTLSPIVNIIKQDRDDSRNPPPVWVNDNGRPQSNDETSIEEIDTSNISQNQISADSISQKADLDSMSRLKKGDVLIKIWDWNVEDKDSVSIIFNNELIADKMRVRNQPYYIKRSSLRYGENYLEIIAMNAQKGANTVAIKGMTDRGVICDTALLQNSHQTIRLTLKYQ